MQMEYLELRVLWSMNVSTTASLALSVSYQQNNPNYTIPYILHNIILGLWEVIVILSTGGSI
jgi:hypothetical protein